jgi:hypothetical protein
MENNVEVVAVKNVKLPVFSEEEWAKEWEVVRARCGDPNSSECASCGGCAAALFGW